jgi:tetrapyrrole methylase family protein / MazG family protein
MAKKSSFIELKNVFKALHGPKGCLWDKKQTHKSLISGLKEEVREYIDTVDRRNPQHMKEELGDILLHVMFNAQIASKNGKFDIEDVIDGLIVKLKRRHPHVFGNARVNSAEEIIRNWNRIKREEKAAESGKPRPRLSGNRNRAGRSPRV